MNKSYIANGVTIQPTIQPISVQPTNSPSNNPTYIPTYELFGATEEGLFVFPKLRYNYKDASKYCQSHYFDIANIYDPNENDMILRFVNLHFIDVFIGYTKNGTTWSWQSNVDLNPMLWLKSPLAQITSNIENPKTQYMLASRYGWKYADGQDQQYFVCTSRPFLCFFCVFLVATRKICINLE